MKELIDWVKILLIGLIAVLYWVAPIVLMEELDNGYFLLLYFLPFVIKSIYEVFK